MKLSKVIPSAFAASAMLTMVLAAPAFGSESVCTMATTEALNLRAGESTSSQVVAVMPKDTSVEVYGMSAAGWYHVKYQDKTGYCYYRWLGFEGTEDGTIKDGKTTDMFPTCTVNLRSEPNTNCGVLKVIDKDTPVHVSAKNDNWFTCEYDGVTGYIYGKYLGFTQGGYTPQGQEENTAGNSTMNQLTASVNLNVRATPNGKVIGSFKKGETVSVISEDGGWCRVKFGSAEGYCAARFLS